MKTATTGNGSRARRFVGQLLAGCALLLPVAGHQMLVYLAYRHVRVRGSAERQNLKEQHTV